LIKQVGFMYSIPFSLQDVLCRTLSIQKIKWKIWDQWPFDTGSDKPPVDKITQLVCKRWAFPTFS